MKSLADINARIASRIRAARYRALAFGGHEPYGVRAQCTSMLASMS